MFFARTFGTVTYWSWECSPLTKSLCSTEPPHPEGIGESENNKLVFPWSDTFFPKGMLLAQRENFLRIGRNLLRESILFAVKATAIVCDGMRPHLKNNIDATKNETLNKVFAAAWITLAVASAWILTKFGKEGRVVNVAWFLCKALPFLPHSFPPSLFLSFSPSLLLHLCLSLFLSFLVISACQTRLGCHCLAGGRKFRCRSLKALVLNDHSVRYYSVPNSCKAYAIKDCV